MTVNWFGRIPDGSLNICYVSDAEWNEANYRNPTLDQLVFKARGQVNLEDRKETYAEIQQILINEVPRIVPVFMPVFMGLRDNVEGVEAHPAGFLRLAPVSIEE